MQYTFLERQIITTRKTINRLRNEGDKESVEMATKILKKLEKKYEKDGNEVENLGYNQLNEAWLKLQAGKLSTVTVYWPKVNDEVVITRRSSYDSPNWQSQLKAYSLEELDMIKEVSSSMLKSIHMLKSEIAGTEVVSVE